MLGCLDIKPNKSKQKLTMNRNKKQITKQADQAHRLNIQKSLQHRIEVAKAQGNEALLRQLEAEMNYFN